jgi:hypothetical protein
MNTTSHIALTGAALRLRLIELLAPTCGMETPATARATYDFVVGETQRMEIPQVEIRIDPPAPAGGEPLTRPGWQDNTPAVEPEPEPEQAPAPAAGDDEAEADLVGVKGRLLELCRQGLELGEINKIMGWNGSTASARISSFRFTKIYKEARARRRSESAGSGQPAPEPEPAPRIEDQPGYLERLEQMCEQGLSASQIAGQLGCKHHVVASKVAKAALTNVWREGQAKRKTQTEAEPPVATSRVDVALAKLDEPQPERRPNRKPIKPAAPSSARTELAAHKVDGIALPPDVPLTKAGPKAWEHPGGRSTIADVIAWLRHSGDTVIDAGKGMWLMNGEQAAARDLVERANRQRKRLRDPRYDLFEPVKG